jgi:hypothetical protein
MASSSKPTSASENETPVTTTTEEPPWRKAMARSLASCGTWFVTEYPKLIYQQQQQHDHNTSKQKHPLVTTYDVYMKTSPSNHLKGATSSAAQRGSSALIMFYGQAYILQGINFVMGQQDDTSRLKQIATSGLAGFLSGGVSSLVHTLFEPIKIRHEPLSWNIYKKSLWPMMWRHALFDGAFFATSTAFDDHTKYSYATQFGVAALVASTVNLTHDVWKTRFIQAIPSRLKWIAIAKPLIMSSGKQFRQQLYVKAADLGFNWWFTGFLYALLFTHK